MAQCMEAGILRLHRRLPCASKTGLPSLATGHATEPTPAVTCSGCQWRCTMFGAISTLPAPLETREPGRALGQASFHSRSALTTSWGTGIVR